MSRQSIPTPTLEVMADLPALRLIKPPRSARKLSRLMMAIMLVTPLLLTIVPWQQNLPGTGRVVAYHPNDRQQTLSAPVDGRISHWWVVEGSVVAAGDPILQISDNDPQILDRLRQQRNAAETKLNASKREVEVYGGQIEALEYAREQAIDAATSHLAMATERVRSAEQSLAAERAALEQEELDFVRKKLLSEDGIVSTLEYQRAERKFKEAQAKMKSADASLKAAMNDEAAKRADLRRVDTENKAKIDEARAKQAKAEGEAALAEKDLHDLELKLARQSTQLINAPRDGVIQRLLAQPGAELVKAGQPLAVFVPDSDDRAVELWVDGNDAPLIDVGRKVRLQFEGWPAVQFAGWPSVAVGTFGGVVSLVDAHDNGLGQFRILILPDPDEPDWPSNKYLRQGVRANGWVLLNQVRLGYEFWRQINGFPPVVSMEAPSSEAKGVGKK